MREAVQRIYRERRALTASLKVRKTERAELFVVDDLERKKDVDSAVAKLDAVLVCVALIFILFACLLILNQNDTLASLVPFATIILGFSFIFGHSAQVLFESVRYFVNVKGQFLIPLLASLHLLYTYIRRRGPGDDRRPVPLCQRVWPLLHCLPTS